MTPNPVPDDWWPDWLKDFAEEISMAMDPVVVAEIGGTQAHYDDYRQVFAALVSLDRVDAVLETPGGVGYEVSATGPHPGTVAGLEYTPRFWISAGGGVEEGLEPLVLVWRSGNHTTLSPEPGFLMTYGLTPRPSDTLVYWDDLESPRRDVVIVSPVSRYEYPKITGAWVKVARDFLQDYAAIRNRALVQVYYLERTGNVSPELEQLIGPTGMFESQLKGRLVDLRWVEGSRERILAQVWGVRLLAMPGASPITAGRWEYGDLRWPARGTSLTKDKAMKLRMDKVYVRDSVLGAFEGRPEFSIHPESGSVTYGNQWSVGFCRRVGRDLIELELKKLYEGNRPETVRHWHAFAIEPPQGVADQPNVGSRAKRIVYSLADLGEVVAGVASDFTSLSVKGADIVSLDRKGLDYSGWWKADAVEPVARHIPLRLTEDEFLTRCSNLSKLVVEGLAEKKIRGLLSALGTGIADPNIRSLKLLDSLLQVAHEAGRTGVSMDQAAALKLRAEESAYPPRLGKLFALNALRQLSDHRAEPDWPAKFDEALTAFGLNKADHRSGWGLALDAVYDEIGEELEDAVAVLKSAIA